MSTTSNGYNIYTVVMEEKGLILNHDKHELKSFTKVNTGKSCQYYLSQKSSTKNVRHSHFPEFVCTVHGSTL